jgi:hypothetical protein
MVTPNMPARWGRSMLGGVALLAAVANPCMLRGQHATQSVPAADSSCTYERCALRVEGWRLVRGSSGETVSKPGVFSSRHLLPFVAGDTARRYAAQYEQYARRASRLTTVGTLLFVAMYAGGQALDYCQSAHDCREYTAVNVGAVVAALGGFAAFVTALHYGTRAERAQSRALWWHNARFAR